MVEGESATFDISCLADAGITKFVVQIYPFVPTMIVFGRAE